MKRQREGREGEGFDRRRAATDAEGRKSERQSGPDAFLIDGPKNLCEGRLLRHRTHRRAFNLTQPSLCGRVAAGEPRIHHGGGGAVDLRGPTGDLENELTISITHKEGDAARNIIQRKKERSNERAPARDWKRRGQKRVEESMNGRKSPAERLQARPGPGRSAPVYGLLCLMCVIRFHIPNDDYNDDDGDGQHDLRVRVSE